MTDSKQTDYVTELLNRALNSDSGDAMRYTQAAANAANALRQAAATSREHRG